MLASDLVATAITATPGGCCAIVVYARSSDVRGIPVANPIGAVLNRFGVTLDGSQERVRVMGGTPRITRTRS